MKIKLICAAILLLAITALVAAPGGSHPDSKSNGKDSPRFYASPHVHPSHP